MAAVRGLYSCNYCEGKFPSQSDIEGHILLYHQERLSENLAVSNGIDPPTKGSTDQLEGNSNKPIVDATTLRGLYACNYCDAKFPSETDIHRHVEAAHVETLRMSEPLHDGVKVLETNNLRQRIPHSETQEPRDFHQGRSFLDKDPENIMNLNDEEDEEESEYAEMMYHLTALRQAAIPLKMKIRTKKADGQKLKYWPELSEQVGHLSGAAWFQSQGENFRSMRALLRNMSNMFGEFALWNSLLKTVEGKFGGGVFNFFKFLKWSMGLNLIMAFLTVTLITVPEHFNEKEALMCDRGLIDVSIETHNSTLWFPEDEPIKQCCTEAYDNQTNIKREPLQVRTINASAFFSDIGTVLLNLVQGDG